MSIEAQQHAASTGICEHLERARRDLLDLSARNRLLNTPRSHRRSSRLEIVDERSDEVFRLLVTEGRAMSFLPAVELNEEDRALLEESAAAGQEILLFQPEDEPDDEALARRHTDRKLQTSLPSETLQKRLLKLYYDARTIEEEQGVNTLFLALGFLEWFESDNGGSTHARSGKTARKSRFAPLLLVPVNLERKSARSRFQLRFAEEDIETNLSLQAKLKAEFGVLLPDLPEVEDLIPTQYFAQVEQAIEGQADWQVHHDDMVLWFFSFSKFLMYRDLDAANWPDEAPLEAHALIEPLLDVGFDRPAALCGPDDPIDDLIAPRDATHVMDADSSQALAIEEVRRGHNLVIQGPPGTGKSQTITNMIASAVRDGRSVLFVAEKMAALEVVKQRLDRVGLGPLCLELHSHKANKRAVVEELAHTLSLGRPRDLDFDAQAERLRARRDELNEYARLIHRVLEPAGLTPYQIIGQLVALSSRKVPTADFELSRATCWSPDDVRRKRELLQDVVVQLEALGSPLTHPWRGVALDAPLLPGDLSRLIAQLHQIQTRLETLRQLAAELANLCQLHAPLEKAGFWEVSRLAQLARQLCDAPELDRNAIGHERWDTDADAIEALVQAGRAYSAAVQAVQDDVAEVAWSTDVAPARVALAAHGRSWLRWLQGDYRRAQALLRGILKGPPPKALDERIALLDALLAARQNREHVESTHAAELGAAVFGTDWRGVDSDWDRLEAIMAWVTASRAAGVHSEFRKIASRFTRRAETESTLAGISGELKPVLRKLEAVCERLRFNPATSFHSADLKRIPLSSLSERLGQWIAAPEDLTRWITWQMRRRRLADEELQPIAERIDGGSLEAASVPDQFEIAYFEALGRLVFEECPLIAEFSGDTHEQRIEQFRQLDKERIQLARAEVALAHFARVPNSDYGEMALIRHETSKKRRHIPIRKLLAGAGSAIQAIKPVFMMSPVSIAQFLEPGKLEFDLLLIDEASQVRPVDALGAVARARQIVVVGDDKQLPPTSFFSRVLNEELDDDEDEIQNNAADLESILGLCVSRNIAQRMLRWHYRSRHDSLIAVSNHEFYEDNLFVIPSPQRRGGELGLRFHHIADGVFDRGRSRTNRIEAQAVARAVVEHAQTQPDKTLGVGTFSVAQRDAILDEIELLRRTKVDVESFFTTGNVEPFFVKNLENIQGDERDVIFISVGYAPDDSGYFTMGFGPLSAEGGHRRLNVLITRARERCEVFSSITGDAIDLRRTQARGTAALKTFLDFARNGQLETPRPTRRGHDSEFESQVARAVQQLGYEVDAQVGTAGFYIDLAVVDPDRPGSYLLGIECDGASYHSARSARDRDRLRQAVLEDRGWTIHRIWSTDWFHRPEEQLRETVAAIEAARIGREQADTDTAPSPSVTAPAASAPEPDVSSIERHEPSADDADEPEELQGTPYVEADFPVDTSRAIHELAVDELAEVVEEVVRVESPIHGDEVARRVSTLWGQSRTGARISRAVSSALDACRQCGRVRCEEDFFSHVDQTDVPVRSREHVSANHLRKTELLPPTEVRAAVVRVVNSHIGVNRQELCTLSARLLGFKAAGSRFRALLETQLEQLLAEGHIEERRNRLFI